MFVAFDQLPPQARVWIYQASRSLDPEELVTTLPALARFAEEWTSHGRELAASATFLHQQFLVIGLDETGGGASGCSIDSSVRFVRELEQHLHVELLEKSRLAFLRDGTVQLLDSRQIRAAVAAGEVQADTFFFDNTLTTKQDLDSRWPAPAAETWLARYFSTPEKKAPLA